VTAFSCHPDYGHREPRRPCPESTASSRSTPCPGATTPAPPDRPARGGGIDDARAEAPPAARRAEAPDTTASPLTEDDLDARLPRARANIAELTFVDYRLAAAHPPALDGLDVARFYELAAVRHERAAERETPSGDGTSWTAWARARHADLAARLRARATEVRADADAEAEVRRRRTETG
jgi:hypothetical protein